MIKTNKLFAAFIAVMLIAMITTGCQYRSLYHVYDDNSEFNDREPIMLFMPVWQNNTSVFGLESKISNKVADWLQSSKNIMLTDDQSKAQYQLDGVIKTINLTSSRGTVILTAYYQLTNKTTGETVWPEQSNTFSKSYLITSDSLSTQDELEKALAEIADNLGEKIYVRFSNHMKEFYK